jgi:hypothetical protein
VRSKVDQLVHDELMREVDVPAMARPPEGFFEDHGLPGHNVVELIVNQQFFAWRDGFELYFSESGDGDCHYNLLASIMEPFFGDNFDWGELVLDLSHGSIEFEPVFDTLPPFGLVMVNALL